ncbi:pyridoxal phosphate-dependent aminotransferase [Rubritalea profundi]|uniref:alanine transaminase n=1 Tax=Rubritalea profundi TaxID=1658618 RepID=A0A2S7U122_9BACT|nr:pyridoxal phosphate-dependent aminotransferase [Rubritalea profundi]PQJ28197.1 aminotransferase [Rubritalea profundi]
MKYRKAEHLNNAKYEIRGKVADKAAQLKLRGINILELNIGNPGIFGFQVPDTMNMAIIRNLDKAAAYSDSKGIFAAREAIVIETQNIGIKGVDIDHVFLGNGVSELIMMSMEALLNPEEEVLIPSPDYPLWTAAVNIANGKAVHYNCDSENDWQPDLEHMEAQISARTRALVVINPNNPTGAVYSKETLEEITAIARRHRLIIFSDEIYSKILYDDIEHVPMAILSDDVLVVTFNGLSKSYRACGFRAGWLYLSGPVQQAEDYIDGLTQLLSMRLCSNVPAQWAIQTALGGNQSIYQLTADGGRLKRQRDLTIKRLRAIEGISCVNPQSALYAFPEIDLSLFDFDDDEDFIIKLLEEEHVLLVQGSGFNYDRSYAFRVVFLPHEETLNKAFDRLENFLSIHRKA